MAVVVVVEDSAVIAETVVVGSQEDEVVVVAVEDSLIGEIIGFRAAIRVVEEEVEALAEVAIGKGICVLQINHESSPNWKFCRKEEFMFYKMMMMMMMMSICEYNSGVVA